MEKDVFNVKNISVDNLFCILRCVVFKNSKNGYQGISKDTGLTYSYLHKIIKTMMLYGLVKVKRDKRHYDVTITKDGERLFYYLCKTIYKSR